MQDTVRLVPLGVRERIDAVTTVVLCERLLCQRDPSAEGPVSGAALQFVARVGATGRTPEAIG